MQEEIEARIERALRFFDATALGRLLPRECAAAAMRAAAGAADGPERAARRFVERWDDAVAALRVSDRSLASLLGPEATDAIVRAVGELEPDERMVRALFAERGAEALLASLLYDGIVEFLKKMNSLGDLVPGVSFAKKLGGGLFAGLAGGFGDAFEKRMEAQVKSFLQGFVKIALERGVAFVTSPANRAVFREARERIARKALERSARDLLARVPEERARALRDRLAASLRTRLAALAAPGGAGSADAVLEPLYRRFAGETAAAIAEKYALLRPEPGEIAKLLAPALALFLESEKGF